MAALPAGEINEVKQVHMFNVIDITHSYTTTNYILLTHTGTD